MNAEESKPDLESNREVTLKIVSDNVVSLNLPVDNAVAPSQIEEPRCQNGVCTLNWKPRRVA